MSAPNTPFEETPNESTPEDMPESAAEMVENPLEHEQVSSEEQVEIEEPKPEIKKMKVRSEKPIEEPKKEEPEPEPGKKPTRKKAAKKEKAPAEETIRSKESKKNFLSIADLQKNPDYAPGENKRWYVLKVQVNREDSIKDALKRRVMMAGYEIYFGEILIPTEKVTEVRSGKKRIVKKKLYPGYLMINMEINEETWFLVRETTGIGDFTGATGKPTPMLEHEIQAMLRTEDDTVESSPNLKIPYQVGDRIKVKEGTFENFEGEVHQIDVGSGRVTVMINIFGRSTPVELEYWQIETLD